ncbi:hypothetical protein V6N11_064502 [Hibiscus sabdariffa]
MKSLKTRVQRMKVEMGKIREDQRCIREEQLIIGERFGVVARQCHELRLETQVMVEQSTFNRVRLGIMVNILRARQDGEFDKAAVLTAALASVSDGKKL